MHWPVIYWSKLFNETIFKQYITFCLGPTQLYQSSFLQCSGIIATVSFTGAMASRFLQRVNGILPNRLSFSRENREPLGLVFLKQNGQKLSLDNFRVDFSSVTRSKGEGGHFTQDILKPPEAASRKRWEQSRLLYHSRSISDANSWVEETKYRWLGPTQLLLPDFRLSLIWDCPSKVSMPHACLSWYLNLMVSIFTTIFWKQRYIIPFFFF